MKHKIAGQKVKESVPSNCRKSVDWTFLILLMCSNPLYLPPYPLTCQGMQRNNEVQDGEIHQWCL